MTVQTQHIASANLADTLEPIEKSVLGSLLIDSELALTVEVNAYFFPTWGKVAELIISQIQETGKIDTHTLAMSAERSRICTQQEIYGIFANAAPQDFGTHVEILRQEWIRQQEIGIHRESLERFESGEPIDDILQAAAAQREIIRGNGSDENKSRARRSGEFFDNLMKQQRGELPSGVPTGLKAFDELTGGFGIPNRVRVIAARPGMGKSTLLYQIATSLAEQGCPVAIISLEMLFAQMMEIVVEQQKGIHRSKMHREGGLSEQEQQEVLNVVEWIHDLPIYVEDNLFELGPILRKMTYLARRYGVRVFLIDYLQLVDDNSKRHQNKNEKVGFISRAFSVFAQREGADVTLFSQLSRAVETRGGDKVPQMSDIRDSGNVEQDAGMIGFLYRPEYYGIQEDLEGVSLVGHMKYIQRKDRYARKLGESTQYYDTKYNRYESEEVDRDYEADTSYNPNITPAGKNNDDEDIPF